jgi:hypothetical protein
VLSHYSLTKRNDGWVIAIDGAELLVCARRKTAWRAIRDAIAHELSSLPAANAFMAATHGEHHDDADTEPHNDILARIARKAAVNSSS